MLRDKQKRLIRFLLSFFTLHLVIVHTPAQAHLTSLAKNDALPMFTTLNLDDEYLLTREQLEYKFDGSDGREYEWADKKRNRAGIFLSPFAQNADRGKMITGQLCNPTISPCPWLNDTPLGDLTGRTSMIAMLYSNAVDGFTNFPQGQTLPESLTSALNTLFPITDTATGARGGLNNEGNIDPAQQYGFFSFPLTYRKRGIAFEASVLFAKNFGLLAQARVSTIRQVSERVIDLTAGSDFAPLTSASVTKPNTENFLMDPLGTIAEEIHVNLCNFIKTAMEEVWINLYWRQAFPMNENAESEWARFLLIPYVEVGAGGSFGKLDNDFKFFAVPFGNNKHNSVGFTAGINFDFLQTIEIGGEAGYTHFFSRTYCRPIPTSEFQSNLFPFSTNVKVSPGGNWYFGARIAAYHFLEHLSMYFEWFVLDHAQDTICLTEPDPTNAFLPGDLACTTSFKTKLGNAGFNYDLSPNLGLGFLWQIPFSQRNSYRSSTLMASINVTF